jgi:putative transposase
VELEAETFLAGMQDLKLPDGRDRLVRHGYGPERMIQTGIGPVAVSRVKIRDRGAASDDDRVRFSSSILPKWARRTRSLDALLPILYLRGSRQETSRRLLRRCSAGTHRTCRLQ